MKTNQISFSSALNNKILKPISFRKTVLVISILLFTLFNSGIAFSQTSTQQIIRLKVSNGIITDETIILFMPNATDGFDLYDSPKISNNNDLIPEIYTMIGTEKMVINSMPPFTTNKYITLGLKTGLAGTFTITNNEFTNFPVGTTLKLVNNTNGQEQVISDGSVYSFTTSAIARNDMFTVKIELADTTVVEPEPDPVQNIVFTVNSSNRIMITCNEKIERGATLAVYNSATGKLAYAAKLSNQVTVINKKLSIGIYTVVVKNGGVTTTGQVLVSNS